MALNTHPKNITTNLEYTMKSFKELYESVTESTLNEAAPSFTRTSDDTVKWGGEVEYTPGLDRIAANNYYLNRAGDVVKLEKDDTGTFDAKKGTTFAKGGWTRGKGMYAKTDLVFKIGKESDYKKFKAAQSFK